MLHERIPITVGWIDLAAQRVHRGATEVKLSTREVQVLSLLASRPGEIVSYEELLREIWETSPNSKAARQAIKRLRPKIEQDPQNPEHLISEFGKGLSLIPLSAQEAMASLESSVPTNLTARNAPIFGVEDALHPLVNRLKDTNRWVTLVGTGGIGKTHLAQEAGRQLAESGVFRGGVWFYDASTDHSLGDLISGLARCLRITSPNMTDPANGLKDFAAQLSHRPRTLVIVDNLEQLTEGARQAFSIWVRLIPAFSWLATSRAVIGGAAEQVVVVEPIAHEPALALYTHVAGKIENESQVRRALDVLNGIPLAIRCLASQVVNLGETEALATWPDDASKHTGGVLHAVFQWSWDLLTQAERRVLQQISAFDDALPLEALEEIVVADDDFIEDLVQALLDKSMLVVRPLGRFATLMPVREFVRQFPLEERAALFRRHRLWFAQWSREAGVRLQQISDPTVVSEIRKHYRSHLLHALEQFTASPTPAAIGLIEPIEILYEPEADRQLIALCEHLWNQEHLSTADEIDIAMHLMKVAQRTGQLQQAAAWNEKVVERITTETDSATKAKFALLNIRWSIIQQDSSAANALYTQAMALPDISLHYKSLIIRHHAAGSRGEEQLRGFLKAYELLADSWGVLKVELGFFIGALLAEMNRLEESLTYLAQVERHARRLDINELVIESRMLIALVEALQGRWESANQRMAKAYAMNESTPWPSARLMSNLRAGLFALMQGQVDTFWAFNQHMLNAIQQMEPAPWHSECLGMSAIATLMDGDPQKGRQQWDSLTPDLMACWEVDEAFCDRVWSLFEGTFTAPDAHSRAALQAFATHPPTYQTNDTCFIYYLMWLRHLSAE